MLTEQTRNPKNFQVILLTFPNIVDSGRRTIHEEGQRSPLTGTIDEIGHDVKKIKEMGISHIIFGFNFSSIGANIDNVIEITTSSQSLLDRNNTIYTIVRSHWDYYNLHLCLLLRHINSYKYHCSFRVALYRASLL